MTRFSDGFHVGILHLAVANGDGDTLGRHVWRRDGKGDRRRFHDDDSTDKTCEVRSTYRQSNLRLRCLNQPSSLIVVRKSSDIGGGTVIKSCGLRTQDRNGRVRCCCGRHGEKCFLDEIALTVSTS